MPPLTGTVRCAMRFATPLLLFLLCGCYRLRGPDTTAWPTATPHQMPTPQGTKYWVPSALERKHGEELARWHARRRLRLSESQLSKMNTDFRAFYNNEQPVLTVGFFDPKYHKADDRGHYSWPLGGFPSFFSVDIDPKRWQTIGDYASPE